MVDRVVLSVFEVFVGQVVSGIPSLGISLYFLLEALCLRVGEIMKELDLCLLFFKADLVIMLLP